MLTPQQIKTILYYLNEDDFSKIFISHLSSKTENNILKYLFNYNKKKNIFKIPFYRTLKKSKTHRLEFKNKFQIINKKNIKKLIPLDCKKKYLSLIDAEVMVKFYNDMNEDPKHYVFNYYFYEIKIDKNKIIYFEFDYDKTTKLILSHGDYKIEDNFEKIKVKNNDNDVRLFFSGDVKNYLEELKIDTAKIRMSTLNNFINVKNFHVVDFPFKKAINCENIILEYGHQFQEFFKDEIETENIKYESLKKIIINNFNSMCFMEEKKCLVWKGLKKFINLEEINIIYDKYLNDDITHSTKWFVQEISDFNISIKKTNKNIKVYFVKNKIKYII